MPTLTYIGTMLPCYLTDHHTREGEYLLGVPVDSATTTGQVRDALQFEFQHSDVEESECSDVAFDAALEACLSGTDPAALWAPRFTDCDLPESGDAGEEPQAFFCLTL